MKKIKFKTSATGCRVVRKELVDQPPESPVIGLIETPASNLPNVDTAEKSSEPSPEHTPAAAEGASNAGGSGSNGAEGSKGPSIRLVPF